MGGIGQSKEGTRRKGQKGFTEGKKQNLNILRTEKNIHETLRNLGVEEEDIDGELANELEKSFGPFDEEGPMDDFDDIAEYGRIEDDDIDFDEPYDNFGTTDPFDTPESTGMDNGKYVAKTLFDDGKVNVIFLTVPFSPVDDRLINKTIFERCLLFYEMASFIAQKQKAFFVEPSSKNLNTLNQNDLLQHLKKHKVAKEHVSRLLDNLAFRIDGVGEIKAKFLFKRYGYRLKFAKDDKIALARKFLSSCPGEATLLQQGKDFREFLIKEAGASIREQVRYKHLENILKEARDE